MNKLTLQFGALTIAAALTFAFTSCSSSGDDPTEPPVVEPMEPAPQTIQITVGAGIDNGASTRSTVETTGTGNSTTRKLKFTSGDKLYVTGNLADGKILAGFLDYVATETSFGTSTVYATFTGTYTSTKGVDFSIGTGTGLHVYQYNTTSKKYLTVSYSFTNTTNPLDECTLVSALLVHNGTLGNLEIDPELSYAQLMPMYTNSLVTTGDNLVDELMTKRLYVSGPYSDSKFSLKAAETNYCSPIFNCNISGLAASTTYQVEHTFDDYSCSVGEVTTDINGRATFAYYISNMKNAYDYVHTIRFKCFKSSTVVWKKINLGTLPLVDKVYNVTRPQQGKEGLVTDENTPGRPTFTGITAPEPNAKGGYIFNDEATTFTLSGTSTGYYFRFKKKPYVTLDGFTATYNALNSGLWGFFDCDDDIYLYLKGSNSITCKNKDQCIYVFGNMFLTGDDGATLTVTCKSSSTKGIQAEGGIRTSEGYTINISEMTDNKDDTYSWTYTVTKTN